MLLTITGPPGNKDESGWHGPVSVTGVGQPKGTITCRINGKDRPCRLTDVRFSMLIALVHFTDESSCTSERQCSKDVKEYIQALKPGSHKLFGSSFNNSGKLVTTKATTLELQFAQRLFFFIANVLTLRDVFCVRVGKGLKHVKAFPGADYYYLVYWLPRSPFTIVELANIDQDLSQVLYSDDLKETCMRLIAIAPGQPSMSVPLNEEEISASAQPPVLEEPPAPSFPSPLESIPECGEPEASVDLIMKHFFLDTSSGE